MPEDGGDGTCFRGELGYAVFRPLKMHDCPRFKKRPVPRSERKPPEQEGLF